jgi:hypothetical protein
MNAEPSMKSITIRSFAAIVIAGSLAVTAGARADTPADEASDICPLTSDPCLVTNQYDIVSGSTLDFGARAMVVQSGGQLDFQDGASTILCGDLTVLEKDTFARILVRGNGMGGSARIIARGRCSLGTTIPCLEDADCAAGTCSATTGRIDLGDEVNGSASPGGTLRMVAYNSIVARKPIDLDNGGVLNAEGGTLDLETREGSIHIMKSVHVQGGAKSSGGSVLIRSAADLMLDGDIDATGGEDRGGNVDLAAAGDIFINNDINVRSASGPGVGGEIHINAEDDLAFAGVGPTNKTVMDSMGHRDDLEQESGDGGDQSYSAGGTITVGPYVLFEASAPDPSNPDAEGGQVELSTCDLNVQSLSELKSSGKHGGGIRLVARSSMTISSGGSVEATNKPGGNAGEIELIVRAKGTCSNDPARACFFSTDCVIGCSTGNCNNSNLNTGGTFDQFDPEPDVLDDQGLPVCD